MPEEVLDYDVEEAVTSFDRKCRGIKTPSSLADAADLERQLRTSSGLETSALGREYYEEPQSEPILPFLQGAQDTSERLSSYDDREERVESPRTNTLNNGASSVLRSAPLSASRSVRPNLPLSQFAVQSASGSQTHQRDISTYSTAMDMPSSPIRRPKTDYSYIRVPLPPQSKDPRNPAANSKVEALPSHTHKVEKLQQPERRWWKTGAIFFVLILVGLTAAGGISYASVQFIYGPSLTRPHDRVYELQNEISELRREILGLGKQLADLQTPPDIPIAEESVPDEPINYKWNWASATAGAHIKDFSNIWGPVRQDSWWVRALNHLRPSTDDGDPGSLIGTSPGRWAVKNSGSTLRIALAEPAHINSVMVTADDPVKISVKAFAVYDPELNQWNKSMLLRTIASGFNKVDLDLELERFDLEIRPELFTTVRSVAAYGPPPAAS